MAETKVKIYFDPPSWFQAQLPETAKRKNLVTLGFKATLSGATIRSPPRVKW